MTDCTTEPSDEVVEAKLREIATSYDPHHELLQLVLYAKPKDLAEGFVVRAWFVGSTVRPGPGFGFWKQERAEEWIAQEFPMLTRVERMPGDEPQIVAVWI